MSRGYLAITVIIGVCCTLTYVDAASAIPGYTITARNGGWSGWGRWGRCSKTCDGGVQIRTRTCTNPRPSGGGRRCPGLSYGRRSCPCSKVNGGWSRYGAWSTCSVACGGGTRTRTRTCTNPRPSCCGASCKGSSTQTGKCNTQSCIAMMASRFANAVMRNTIISTRTLSRVRPCHALPGTPCVARAPVVRTVCTFGNRDFLFIVDSSGSIQEANYDQAKLDIALIATALCGNLCTDLQVAAMQFSSNPQKEFEFDEYCDPIPLFDAIMGMTWLKGGTKTWLAFNFAKDVMFTVANGHRPGAKKQALIVTDGKSNGHSNAETMSIAAAQALKDTGVELFALWIGNPNANDLNEIRKYVTTPIEDHVFSLTSVMSLNEFVLELWKIHERICAC